MLLVLSAVENTTGVIAEGMVVDSTAVAPRSRNRRGSISSPAGLQALLLAALHQSAAVRGWSSASGSCMQLYRIRLPEAEWVRMRVLYVDEA